MDRTQIATAALLRSDRYLREFVEALRMCPFAKACREEGRLERRVLIADGAPLDDLAVRTVLAEIETVPAGIDVALFIFPLAPTGSISAVREFQAFGRAVRERLPEPASFYCVAFHPDLPRDLGDAHRAVPFTRRSPDPTLQFVRVAAVQAVRGNSGDRYLDPAKLTPGSLAALRGDDALPDRIAADNLRTLEEKGADEAARLLESFRNR